MSNMRKDNETQKEIKEDHEKKVTLKSETLQQTCNTTDK